MNYTSWKPFFGFSLITFLDIVRDKLFFLLLELFAANMDIIIEIVPTRTVRVRKQPTDNAACRRRGDVLILIPTVPKIVFKNSSNVIVGLFILIVILQSFVAMVHARGKCRENTVRFIIFCSPKIAATRVNHTSGGRLTKSVTPDHPLPTGAHVVRSYHGRGKLLCLTFEPDVPISSRACGLPGHRPGGIRATGKRNELVLLFWGKKNNNVLSPKKKQ